MNKLLTIALIVFGGLSNGASIFNPTDDSTQRYLVKLRSVKTMDTLFKLDEELKNGHHLIDCIKKKFSFGDFEGFTAEFTKDTLLQLQSNPLVAEITPDIVVKAFDIEIQEDAPRHLARLSQRERILPSMELQYHHNSNFEGEDVNAYILDTGVQVQHPEFGGRLEYGADFTGTGEQDLQGHGTHVAGVIGSEIFGVAKQINIVSIKVLDNTGSGTLSSVIEGIEFAVNHMRDHHKLGVGNLSLGALKNTVLNDAIKALHSAGLVMVVAAGNSNADACEDSPLSSPYAITVGAIDDRTDTIAPFSNYGECVNIFASGVYVESLYNRDYHASILMSGTSMSSPSVAGTVAILLSKGIKPQNVAKYLYDTATTDAIPQANIDARQGTPNRIVYSS